MHKEQAVPVCIFDNKRSAEEPVQQAAADMSKVRISLIFFDILKNQDISSILL